jgi:hypothetical protein
VVGQLTDKYKVPRVSRESPLGCQLSVPHPGHCPSTFIDDVSPTNTTGYIRQFHITDEYIVTFVGTDEQVDLKWSELRSSVDSSVNR